MLLVDVNVNKRRRNMTKKQKKVAAKSVRKFYRKDVTKKSIKDKIVLVKALDAKRGVHNKYEVMQKGKEVVFSALKKLAEGKVRNDFVKLNVTQLQAMRNAAKKSKEAFYKKVDELVVRPCKLDSEAKRLGHTAITGYCPAHSHMAKVLGLKIK